MTDEIGGKKYQPQILYLDFETENVISNFKFKLTGWTLDQYSSIADVMVKNSFSNKFRLQREHVFKQDV